MTRFTGLVIAVILFVTPAPLVAQSIDALQAQIATLLAQIQSLQAKINALSDTAPTTQASTDSVCKLLTRDLQSGSSGDDVRVLQQKLAEDSSVYPEKLITGYFGALTAAAIERFKGNILRGSAPISERGRLGPESRRLFIARWCATPALTPDTGASTALCTLAAPPLPRESCAGSWEKIQTLGCHIGWRCNAPVLGNRAPVIKAIHGPAEVSTNAFTTWRVLAEDPEGGALEYSVSWGDERAEDILQTIAGYGGTFVQNASLAHSYSKEGSYTMYVTVRDSAKSTAAKTHVVRVVSGASAPYVPPPIEATEPSCVTPWGSQIVVHGSSASWQPYFTEGSYFASSATSTPHMRCEKGVWHKCRPDGSGCQKFQSATSTNVVGLGLRSYANLIGTRCAPPGSTADVVLPPGTQLCQFLKCSTTAETHIVKLRCINTFWSDYQQQ